MKSHDFILLSGKNTIFNKFSYINIMCNSGHSYYIRISEFKNNSECVYCNNIDNKYNYHYIKRIVENVDGYRLLTQIKDNYVNSIKIKCPVDHEYDLLFNNFKNGSRCPICRKISITGSNNHNYKEDITSILKYLRSFTLKWKNKILNQNLNKCSLTNSKVNVEVHHLQGFETIVQKTLKLLNLQNKHIKDYSAKELQLLTKQFEEEHNKTEGICLNKNIHKLFHDNYKYGNNNKLQFIDFYNDLQTGKYDLFLKKYYLELNKSKLKEILNVSTN